MNDITVWVGLVTFFLTFVLGFCMGALWLAWRVARGDFGKLGK